MGSGAGRGRRGGTAARRPAARFISAPLPAGCGGFAFLGPSRLPALPKSLCSGPIVWRGGVRAAAALFGLLQDSWGSYKKQRQVCEQGVPHCPGCPPPPVQGDTLAGGTGTPCPTPPGTPCVCAGTAGVGDGGWGAQIPSLAASGGRWHCWAPAEWVPPLPGHAGEAPTQVLVAPKVKPPPHSHPSGGSGRPCHRCHRAPQADIYPCPGAAWQRASSARCYFRSRSLAAAPSPHCLAPRGAAGGAEPPRSPPSPRWPRWCSAARLRMLLASGGAISPGAGRNWQGASSSALPTLPGDYRPPWSQPCEPGWDLPQGTAAAPSLGQIWGLSGAEGSQGGLGAHRGSWFLPCPLALSLGSRN